MPSSTLALLKAYRHADDAGAVPPGASQLPIDFDWEEFSTVCLGENVEGIDALGPYRVWAATQLPELVLALLLRSLPPTRLFQHLDSPPYRSAFINATRGFQRNAGVLKQPILQKRLLKWLGDEPVERYPLLEIWHENNPNGEGLLELAWNGPPNNFVEALKKTDYSEQIAPDPARPNAESVISEPRESGALKKAQQEIRQLKGLAQFKESEHNALKTRAAQENANWSRRLEQQEVQATEAQRGLQQECDRLGRKLRATERQLAEVEADNKRLKKQLAHMQQLVEAERKKLNDNAKTEKTARSEAVPVEKKTIVPVKAGPLDEEFSWKADGRPVRVTARAVRRVIDQNDEDAVYTIIQALDALEKVDFKLHKRFLDRLSDGEPFYSRVLTHATTRVLVDASNVARQVPNRQGKGQLKFLLEARDELRRRDCFPLIIIADASLAHHINEPAKFRALVESGQILTTDKGVEADELLAREAKRTGAIVITNDTKFHHKVSPDYEPPRVGFRILDGTVIIEPF